MIYTDKQYEVSMRELAKFKDALEVTRSRKVTNEWLDPIEIDAIKSQIAEIEADTVHYDLLKSGRISYEKPFSLEGLPSALIEARIASGMDQAELAHALGVKPQQVQRNEGSGYLGVSLKRLLRISNVLGVDTDDLFSTTPEQ